jgi:hypothetical protein
MGVLRSTQSLQAEVDELRASLLVENGWRPSGVRVDAKRAPGGAAARTVCVTGGISFIGFAVVDRLLRHGYTVRLALETQGQPPVPSRLSLSALLRLLVAARRRGHRPLLLSSRFWPPGNLQNSPSSLSSVGVRYPTR